MTIRPSLLVFFATAALCLAQSERGNITGVVTDATNAAVPNAPVKIVNMGTNAATSVMSLFLRRIQRRQPRTRHLPPGSHQTGLPIRHRRQHHPHRRQPPRASTSSLQVGGVTQTVEVQSQNAQIQTEDAKISTAVSNKLVDRASARRRRRHAQSL